MQNHGMKRIEQCSSIQFRRVGITSLSYVVHNRCIARNARIQTVQVLFYRIVV